MHNITMRTAAIAAGALLLAGTAAIGAAAPRSTPAQAGTPAAIGFAALESRALSMGIRPEELKIKRGLAEIEGRDATGREVEVKIDAGTGRLLSQVFDDD